LDLQLLMQSVPIITNVVSSIPNQRGVLDIRLCEKNNTEWLATDRWFSPDTPVSSTNNLTANILLKYFWKWR